ncbi:MAG: response regulator [Clostridia bacterium]|nr:response regulator [Clostridia bacterium]
MVRILIVDDEDIIRRGLISMLKDIVIEKIEFLQAENGRAALDIIQGNFPDIIITDIKMPYMDGLQFIERIRSIGCISRIIIISGFGEFDYAKKAITLDVDDYLLKPVHREKLQLAITKSISLIKSKDSQPLIDKQIYILNQTIEELNRKKLFNFMNGINTDKIELEHIIKMLSEYSVTDYFFVLIVDCLNSLDISRNNVEREIISLFENETRKYLHVMTLETQLIFLNAIKDESTIQIIMNDIQSLQSSLLNHKISVAIGMSDFKIGIESLQRLYSQAKICIRQKLVGGQDVFKYSEISKRKAHITFSEEIWSKIDVALEVEDKFMLDKYISELLYQFLIQKNFLVKQIEDAMFTFIVKKLSEITEYNTDNEIVSSCLHNFKNDIISCKKVEDLKIAFLKSLNHYIEINKNYRSNNNNKKIIYIVQEYIKKHYSKNLSLDVLANYVCMNSAYFSSLFKRETGQTLTNYIMDVRLNKAIELLKDPINKIYEIAEKVGFDDDKYFSKVFKKKFGVTPSEFREKS